MKIAVLWAHLSGYMNACLKELAATDNVQLLVANIKVSEVAPFDDKQFSWINEHYQWETRVDKGELLSRLEQFAPDLILSIGWHISGYRFVLKRFRGRSLRILATDQPWQIRPKKLIGVLISKFYIRPLCEAIFITGERQAVYARKLGFSGQRILRGLYCCDHAKFAATYFNRITMQHDVRSFAYVGRLSPEKGIDVLIEAYRLYRKETRDPWPLKCYGTGPLNNLITNVDGIEVKGFTQPDDLPCELLESSCLILPSRYEPWAVVLHEASAAGMAIICTDVVGASVHLVQDGYNGYVVDAGNAETLAKSMLAYTRLSSQERKEMSENSYRMSLQYTPKRWASHFISKAKELMG